MTILITGGGGFLGRSIAKALRERGLAVRSLARNDYPQLAALGVEQLRGDLADADAVLRATDGCEAVFHVAALVEMWGPYERFFATNVLGTRHVIAACVAQRVPKLIYTSTPSVVHGGDAVAGVNESAPYPEHFEAHYPATKAIAERELLAANSPTLATCAIRPHLVWGPDDSSMLPRVLAKARSGRVRHIGAPQTIDACYIDNAVDAHLAAFDRLVPGSGPPAGKAYFITQGEPLSGHDFLDQLVDAAGLPKITKTIGVGPAMLAARVAERVWATLRLRGEPPITRFVVSQLSTAHWYDIGAAKRELGYVPRVSHAEGMARLRAWLREHPC